MQDKSKKSHTSTNFYLVVAILIIAICMSIGYVVSKHYVLQEMIQKNHVPDSTLLHLLEEAKTFLAPVERALAPFKSTISILFNIVVIELGWQFVVSPLVPKKIKSFTKTKKETLLGKIEEWIRNLI